MMGKKDISCRITVLVASMITCVLLFNIFIVSVSAENADTTQCDGTLASAFYGEGGSHNRDERVYIKSNFGQDATGYGLFYNADTRTLTNELIAATVSFDSDGAGSGVAVTENYTSFEEAWNAAVALNTSSENRATVKLMQDVTAVGDGTNNIFGTGSGFLYSGGKLHYDDGNGETEYDVIPGAVFIPVNRYIVLDLNGKTIDRGMTASNQAGGYVFQVDGNLIIDDTSIGSDGKITGGKTLSYGGGFNVAGVLTLNAGNICGNEGGVGAIELAKAYGLNPETNLEEMISAGSFYMNGGAIYGNSAIDYGGGVGGVGSGSVFIMTGGSIYGNNTLTGAGGADVYFAEPGEFMISGTASIENNLKNGVYNSVTGIYEQGTDSTADNILLTESVIKIGNGGFSGHVGVHAEKEITVEEDIQLIPYPTPGIAMTITMGFGAGTGSITADSAENKVVTDAEGEKALIRTYTISYIPGAHGEGDAATAVKTDSIDYTLADFVFTRTGYTQTGWSTSDNGSGTYYAFNSVYTEMRI